MRRYHLEETGNEIVASKQIEAGGLDSVGFYHLKQAVLVIFNILP